MERREDSRRTLRQRDFLEGLPLVLGATWEKDRALPYIEQSSGGQWGWRVTGP